MRVIFFLLLFFLTALADNNITQKSDKTLLESITPTESDKNAKSVAIITKAIDKQKEEQKRKEEQELEAQKEREKRIEAEKQKERELAEKKRAEKEAKRLREKQLLQERIDKLVKKKQQIDEELSKDNIWASQYLPYESYQKIEMKHKKYAEEIAEYESKKRLSTSEKFELKRLKNEYKIIEGKLSQLRDYKKDPFANMVKIKELEDEPKITNPISILDGISYQKQLKSIKEENDAKYASLSEAVVKLREKVSLLRELTLLSKGKKYLQELKATQKKLKDFEDTLRIYKTSIKTFGQVASQISLNIDEGIDKEMKKLMVIGATIGFLLLFYFLIKFLVHKYMSENDLFYGINKIVNASFIVLIILILLFSYLENVKNLMTILSFASAGIAIALKDWFMSILGWIVILVSGSIHVGDRMKFVKDGVEYVGDIVDISILRMTLHEDVTLTTVYTNRRTGRIIFIPNNYIFTGMIANYSHAGLKTVWDGIDFYITFDSNVAKAQHIAKEVTRKYSKGYTDMTRKQLNRLRSKYSVRNTAVEPRILGFLDTYGVRISAWYLTNSFATLTLRSTISMEILSRLQAEDDIQLALPSQSIYMDKPAPRPPLPENEEPI